MTFANQYDDRYLRGDEKLKGYTNEILTKDGTIYTFGLNGNGRFQLTHSTPINDAKVGSQLPITLPNGKVITNYTITLTFRRAADLEPGMPTTPAKITTNQPNEVKPGGEQSSINDDMVEYTRLVEQNNGAQPKTFTVGTRTWTLNKFGNYDWSDPTSGQIYMRNINMETGVSVPEPLMNEPVDPALVEESLNFINSNRKLLALDHKLADMGIDINDFLKQVEQIKTMEDYFKAKKTIDKLCQ
jgi:hypothetical protein